MKIDPVSVSYDMTITLAMVRGSDILQHYDACVTHRILEPCRHNEDVSQTEHLSVSERYTDTADATTTFTKQPNTTPQKFGLHSTPKTKIDPLELPT